MAGRRLRDKALDDRRGGIRGARSRSGQVAWEAGLGAAIGQIGSLGRVGRRQLRDGLAGRVRPEEAEVFAAGFQLEAGMQLTRSRRPVFSRGEDDEVFPRRQRSRGEGPHGRLGAVVGQGPAGELDRLGSQIAQLNPVRAVAIFISKASLVRCEQLVDNKLADRGIGVDGVVPLPAAKAVWRDEEVADAMSRGPADPYVSFRGLLEAKGVGPGRLAADACRRRAIDEEVGRIDARHGLTEGNVDTLQLPHPGVEARQQADDGGRRGVYPDGVDQRQVELRIA